MRQALDSSAKDSHIEYTVQDMTSDGTGMLRTDTLADGGVSQGRIDAPHDMASPKNLAKFVAHVLDDAEASGAKQTWIELTDHGAGDGGGLEADSARGIMRMPDMANAIAEGVKIHAKEHPEDADRNIDGVVANQCLMASLGFADASSHAGVKWLAAGGRHEFTHARLVRLSPAINEMTPERPVAATHPCGDHAGGEPGCFAQFFRHEVCRQRSAIWWLCV
ncbi:MAG: hypothetical protein ACXVAG_16265 [Vulcanimicrobiaceae bacterium]